MLKWLRFLGVATSIIMLIVIIMGALVTNTGSAQGCGHHWPLCYGQVVPDLNSDHTWIEFSHRAVTGIAGILIVILAVWSWILYSKVSWVKFLCIGTIFFVVLQAVLGGLAVIWPQSSFILALHFGISLISFATVLLLTLIIYEQSKWKAVIAPPLSKGFRVNLVLCFIYLYIVIYSGAFVRHTDSSLGCLDFPLCNGQLIPPLLSRAGFQYTHRLLAGVLVIWLIINFIHAFRYYRNSGWVYWLTLLSILITLCQAASGVMVIFTRMQLSFLLLHSFFVTLLFGALSFLLMFAIRKTKAL
ncbi:heme A synthase [Pullulanibacillus sp. KACC 23026]|uniref:COX15/CtaA family protein n=1 Tax=Pullulanibacillus sp. KACC 23026 TaxID=3028315 RepID=UPI0023AF45B3|nr:heme A synthase [Pullulanibacillus sp. KACC 23026]WEG11708.1 heme A synthase [Pullulanibacillus sp. KACC 23026]